MTKKGTREKVLLVFVKNPQLGRVKTRLARTMGETRALEVYHQLLAKAQQLCAAVSSDVWIFYSDHIPQNDPWFGSCERRCQVVGDLGERMHGALASALLHYRKAILIGSDIPGLTVEMVERAFVRLGTRDMVLGPVEDGGYGLIGMKASMDYLFNQMPWGTSEVLGESIFRALGHKKSVYLLEELFDIDTEEDWERYLSRR